MTTAPRRPPATSLRSLQARLVVLLLAVVLAGCSNNAATATSTTAPPTTAPPTTAPEGSSDSGGSGSTTPTPVGDQCLLHDGLERCYQLFEPDGAAPDARVPLVIDLHGWTSNPNEQRFISGFEHLASEEGFFVAWPEGVGESFNAGRVCCPPALRDDVDDVGFLRALIDRLASDHPVDRDRVYLTGLSNGCAMAQRMTAEASDLIAATACFSFYLLSDAPGDYQPVPVMEIHATADALVSYDEGRAGLDRTVPTAQENIARWAQLNGCQIEPTVTAEQGWSRTEYTSCDDDADVSLVTIEGSGHVPYRGMNTEINTTSIAWAFLESRRLSDR